MSGLAGGMHLGSYQLLSLIGETRMSEVWRAQDEQGTTVAIKTISASADEDPQVRARFLREGDEHQLLNHPSIVPILDFFEQNGGFYLVMQYLSGGSLEDRTEQLTWKPLPISEALEVSRCILLPLTKHISGLSFIAMSSHRTSCSRETGRTWVTLASRWPSVGRGSPPFRRYWGPAAT